MAAKVAGEGTVTRPARAGSSGRRGAVARRPAADAERRRATPSEQLATELVAVKMALDGALAEFGLRVSGRFGEVLRALEREEPPAKRTVKAMIELVRDVRLKPEKGRLRDLRRVQKLADDLLELVEAG